MPDLLWRWMANAIGLLGLTLIFALGIGVFATTSVSFTAWLVLYIVCVLAFIACAFGWPRPWDSATWFATAFYAILFAAIFYGANGALDALHGRDRNGPEVARSLGGLQVWFVLFPGIASVSLGCALRNSIRNGRCTPSARSD